MVRRCIFVQNMARGGVNGKNYSNRGIAPLFIIIMDT